MSYQWASTQLHPSYAVPHRWGYIQLLPTCAVSREWGAIQLLRTCVMPHRWGYLQLFCTCTVTHQWGYIASNVYCASPMRLYCFSRVLCLTSGAVLLRTVLCLTREAISLRSSAVPHRWVWNPMTAVVAGGSTGNEVACAEGKLRRRQTEGAMRIVLMVRVLSSATNMMRSVWRKPACSCSVNWWNPCVTSHFVSCLRVKIVR